MKKLTSTTIEVGLEESGWLSWLVTEHLTKPVESGSALFTSEVNMAVDARWKRLLVKINSANDELRA